MGIRLFFKKFLSTDEKVEFFAKVASAMIVAAEHVRPGPAEIYKTAEAIFEDLEERELFCARVEEYVEGVEREEWDLNRIIKRIGQISRKNPDWILTLSIRELGNLKHGGEALQDRICELLERLRNEAQTYKEELKTLPKNSRKR